MKRLEWYQKESDRLIRANLNIEVKDYITGLIKRAVNECGTSQGMRLMNEKEAVAVLESIKREIDRNFNYPGLCTRRAISQWEIEIEAINMSIKALQGKE